MQLLHVVDYDRAYEDIVWHGWCCTCGDGGWERTEVKAQQAVALHLWFTKADHDPFGGDDARMAILEHKLGGGMYRDVKGRFTRHPTVTLHDYQVAAVKRRVREKRVLADALEALREGAYVPGEEPVGPFVQSLVADRALGILCEIEKEEL